MKVTFLGQNSPDKFSGGRYHAWMMAEATASLGYDVLFVTDHKPYFYDDFAIFPQHERIRLHLVSILADNGWSMPDYPCDVFIVIPHAKWTPTYYRLARQYAMDQKAPLIMINFESANWFNEFSPVQRGLEQWDGWKLCSESASMILSSSAEGTKYAKEFYNTTPKHTIFSHCYPPINTIVADTVRKDEKEKRIILITRFEKADHKGGFLAAQLLCEAMRGYTLTLIVGIGTPPEGLMRELGEAAENYGITINMLQQISDEEKFDLLKRSSLMLFPSYFEGFGLPPVEAQYCNVPCIAFDLPVLREVNGDGLIYVERGNIEAFRRKIAETLNSRVNYNNLKEEISKVARFEHFVKRVYNVIMIAKTSGKPVNYIDGKVIGGKNKMTTGVIKWFTMEKMFGFITPDKGNKELFVHRRFVAIHGFNGFQVGTHVKYVSYEGPKGLEARNVLFDSGVSKTNEIRFGFSECVFDLSSYILRARGWFLGPNPLERVKVYLGKDLFLGQAKVNMRRTDVLNNYPEYNQPNSGWKFEKILDCPINEKSVIAAHIYTNKSLEKKILRQVVLCQT